MCSLRLPIPNRLRIDTWAPLRFHSRWSSLGVNQAPNSNWSSVIRRVPTRNAGLPKRKCSLPPSYASLRRSCLSQEILACAGNRGYTLASKRPVSSWEDQTMSTNDRYPDARSVPSEFASSHGCDYHSICHYWRTLCARTEPSALELADCIPLALWLPGVLRLA